MIIIDPYYNDCEKALYIDVIGENLTNTMPYKAFIENKDNILDSIKISKVLYLVREGVGIAVNNDLIEKGFAPTLISCKELDYYIKNIRLGD